MAGDVFNTGIGARAFYSNPLSRIVGDILNTPTQLIKTTQSFVSDATKWAVGDTNMHIDNGIVKSREGHSADGGNAPIVPPTTVGPSTPKEAEKTIVKPEPVGVPDTSNPNDPNYIGDPNATLTLSQRRKRIAALRTGLASTIKTSPMGLTNQAQTLTPTLMATGMKTKLGV